VCLGLGRSRVESRISTGLALMVLVVWAKVQAVKGGLEATAGDDLGFDYGRRAPGGRRRDWDQTSPPFFLPLLPFFSFSAKFFLRQQIDLTE